MFPWSCLLCNCVWVHLPFFFPLFIIAIPGLIILLSITCYYPSFATVNITVKCYQITVQCTFFPTNVVPQRTWHLDPQLLLCEHFSGWLLFRNLTVRMCLGESCGSPWKPTLGDRLSPMWHIGTRSVPNNLKSWLVKLQILTDVTLFCLHQIFMDKLLLQTEFNALMTWKAGKKKILNLDRYIMSREATCTTT